MKQPDVDLDILESQLGEVDDMYDGLGSKGECCVVVGQRFSVEVEMDLAGSEVLGRCGLAVEFVRGDGQREVQDFAVLSAVAHVDFGWSGHARFLCGKEINLSTNEL